MIKDWYRKNRAAFDRFDGFFLRNTVLERGLVIAPVIVAANTMRNAVVLAIAFGLITLITVFLSSFVSRRLPYSIRVILYTMLASVVFIPVSLLIEKMLPGAIYKVGVFLPLLVTNSLIVAKSESRFFKRKRGAMVVSLISYLLGFLVVICLVGFIREILGNATLWGEPLPWGNKASALMLPFGGFVLVGFLSAGLQKLRLILEGEPEAEMANKGAER